MNKQKIIAQFNKAAARYDQQAIIQKQVARYLHYLIQDLIQAQHCAKPHNIATICDVGCGTGFLTELLCRTFAHTQVTAVDIAPQMIEHCGKNLHDYDNVHAFVCDIATTQLPKKFDVITSSLALQWVENFHHVLQSLWAAANQTLCVSLLCEGTFHEWQSLFQQMALPNPSLHFIKFNQLQDLLWKVPSVKDVGIHQQKLTQRFADIAAFLRHIKSIGVHHSPYAEYTDPHVSANRLRRMLHMQRDFSVTYQVAYCLLRK